MEKKDGMNYAPKGKPAPVVAPGEFKIAAIALDHGHIYGMCNGLTEAGAEVKWVYDPDPAKVAAFQKSFPAAKAAASEEEILSDPEVKLVCGAAVTSLRCALGLRVMAAGKDYFTDKAPLTSLEQLEAAKEMVQKTGRKYMVYYSERIHVEAAVFAGQLIEEAGLKGVAVGGAQVSTLHSGFIINRGGATATDILQLITLVQNRVYDETGVMLEPEVRIIG